MRARSLLLFACLCLAPAGFQASAQPVPAASESRGIALARRVALVMGNQDYRHVPRLQNAVADARALVAQLSERGFQVFEGYDLDRSQMNRLFSRFEAALSPGSIAVFYYAGHGVQVGGANVLLPVDLEANGERDLLDDGVILPQLMDRMAAANGRRAGGLNLLVVDACRDNPFQGAGRSIGVSRGLTATGSSGVMVLYSAGTNQQALDRLGPTDTDPNGLFTRVLLREMQTPGLSVRDLVGRVRSQVAAAAHSVGHEQIPAIYDEAVGDFAFTPAAAALTEQAAAPPRSFASAPAPAGGVDREALFWQSIMGSRDAADFEAYLHAFPGGAFAPIAQNRLAALSAGAASQAPAASRAPDGSGALDTAEHRAAMRQGLQALGYYQGQGGGAPLDDDTRAAVVRFQRLMGVPETGSPSTAEVTLLGEAATKLAALLERSPPHARAVSAAALPGPAESYTRGWAADNPSHGTPRDAAEAAYWYAVAARQGEARAYTQLGLLHARSGSVTGPGEALWLWRAAAARGEAVAMFNLGAAYEYGIGVSADRAGAQRWYAMAAEHRHAGAVSALERLRH